MIKKHAICGALLLFAIKAFPQSPHINYVRVDEFPTATLHILGKFSPLPGTVRINHQPLTTLAWTDTEIICDFDDSIFNGGMVTVITGMDSVHELLSFWELHVEYNDIWSEGSEGDNHTVVWMLGFRGDFQALLAKRILSLELQPTRRSTCGYSIDRNVSAVLSYSGFGIVHCKSGSDTAKGPSFSVIFDIYSDLSTILQLSTVTGYPMTADTGYWNPQPIPYSNYSFIPPDNLSPVFDSNYFIQPYEYAYWIKSNQPQTWIEWHTDSALFLPSSPKASVTQIDVSLSTFFGRVLGTSEYFLPPATHPRTMQIYTALGQLIESITIHPEENFVSLSQLPSGIYFVRLEGLVSKLIL